MCLHQHTKIYQEFVVASHGFRVENSAGQPKKLPSQQQEGSSVDRGGLHALEHARDSRGIWERVQWVKEVVFEIRSAIICTDLRWGHDGHGTTLLWHRGATNWVYPRHNPVESHLQSRWTDAGCWNSTARSASCPVNIRDATVIRIVAWQAVSPLQLWQLDATCTC